MRSGSNEWFYLLIREIARALIRIVFTIRYTGLENLPKERYGYILACNHVSNLDPIIITDRIKPWIRYLAKNELIKFKALEYFFRALGIVPVERGAGDSKAIDECVRLVEKGYILGIFPEGTRFPEGSPGRPKSEWRLSQRDQVGRFSCAIEYERPMHFRSRIIVHFGGIIKYEDLTLEEDSPRAIKRATKIVWDRILSMLRV